LPALSAIRREYPQARLILLSSPGKPDRPGARQVTSGTDLIDELIEYYPEDLSTLPDVIRFISLLRRYRIDVFIEFPIDTSSIRLILRNIILARLAGPRWAGGWMANTLRFGLQKQSEVIEFPNEVQRLLKIVHDLGISVTPSDMLMPASTAGEIQAENIIGGSDSARGKRFIALAPGSKRAGSRWPPDRFAEVGRRLVSAGYHLFIMGSSAERELCERVRRSIDEECTNIAGETDVAGAAALLRRCDLVLCNDSGLQHLASAVGTPCVAVFASFHVRGKWWPNHPESIVLHKMVPCHTCFLPQCPIGDRCVTETSAAEVTDAAFHILKSSASAHA
jgi:ADP-heptose:LPS heptosyltransferase